MWRAASYCLLHTPLPVHGARGEGETPVLLAEEPWTATEQLWIVSPMTLLYLQPSTLLLHLYLKSRKHEDTLKRDCRKLEHKWLSTKL